MHLQAMNPVPAACGPGPNRSVSVAQVLHLNEPLGSDCLEKMGGRFVGQYWGSG